MRPLLTYIRQANYCAAMLNKVLWDGKTEDVHAVYIIELLEYRLRDVISRTIALTGRAPSKFHLICKGNFRPTNDHIAEKVVVKIDNYKKIRRKRKGSS